MCGALCVAPAASLMGFSFASISVSSTWQKLQPFLMAISAVSFTIAYFSLYRSGTGPGYSASNQSCCGPDLLEDNRNGKS